MNLHLEIFLPVILSVIAHEIGHAVVADRLGDPTARLAGRITMNPIRHSTLTGTLILPLATLFLFHGKFMFGGALPIPVNTVNFKNPERGMLLVALAGPIVNFMIAAACFILWMCIWPAPAQDTIFFTILRTTVFVNVVLCGFNLLPIPPLDGIHVARYVWNKFLFDRFKKIL